MHEHKSDHYASSPGVLTGVPLQPPHTASALGMLEATQHLFIHKELQKQTATFNICLSKYQTSYTSVLLRISMLNPYILYHSMGL